MIWRVVVVCLRFSRRCVTFLQGCDLVRIVDPAFVRVFPAHVSGFSLMAGDRCKCKTRDQVMQPGPARVGDKQASLMKKPLGYSFARNAKSVSLPLASSMVVADQDRVAPSAPRTRLGA